MDFFSSDLGIAIAWICTVLSFLFGLIKSKETQKIKLKLSSTVENKQNLENNIEQLKAKVVDLSNNEVNQTGEKNIYTKTNSGGMKIEM